MKALCTERAPPSKTPWFTRPIALLSKIICISLSGASGPHSVRRFSHFELFLAMIATCCSHFSLLTPCLPLNCVVFTVAVIAQQVSLPIFRSGEIAKAAHILPFFGVFITWIILALAFAFLLVRRQVTSLTGKSLLLSFISGILAVRTSAQFYCLKGEFFFFWSGAFEKKKEI